MSPRIHWPRTLLNKGAVPLLAEHLQFQHQAGEDGLMHCLLLDCSGSMLKRSNLALAKGLLLRWSEQVYRQRGELAVIAFGYGGITSYVALLSRERNIHPESLFFTVFAVASVLVRVFTSRLGDRFGYKVLLYPAFVAMPLAFAVLARAQNRMQMAAAALLLGIGMGASWPAFMTFVLSNSAEERRARTFGSVILAFDMGIGLGSVVVGAIGERYSLGRAFNVAALLACLSIPIFLATSRRLARGTAVAENAGHAGNTS